MINKAELLNLKDEIHEFLTISNNEAAVSDYITSLSLPGDSSLQHAQIREIVKKKVILWFHGGSDLGSSAALKVKYNVYRFISILKLTN